MVDGLRAKKESAVPEREGELLAAVAWGSTSARSVSVAQGVIRQAGSLRLLSLMSRGAVSRLDGMTPASASRVCAALELGRIASLPKERDRVSTSADVAAYIQPKIGGLDHEEFWIIALDSRNNILGSRRVAQGTASMTVVDSSVILRAAILEGATSIILTHNHPAGEAKPSSFDIATTRTLRDASRAVGIHVNDHVIVTPMGRYCSFLDLGIL